MAAMTTVLTEFSDNGNSRTYTVPAHTAVKPGLVIQKRKVPSGNQTVLEDTVTVLSGTTDVDGVVLPQRSSISIVVRRPIDGNAADLSAVYTIVADLVFSDEFVNMLDTQEFLS